MREPGRAGVSIPNLITLARILLVPIVIWAITSGEMRIAFLLFFAAGASDAVDGFLAKRFGMATELGAYLDPLADKAMIVSIYVALGIAEAIPRWLVILVVSRDIMIVGAVMLSWLVDKPVALKPLLVSKLNTVAQDWKKLEKEGVTNSPAYLHHRGHPLLAVWGLGFSGRPMTPSDTLKLLKSLDKASAKYGGITIMGGVPSYWRTGTRDASSDPEWQKVWPKLGVLSPWSVGRFTNDMSADEYSASVWVPDLAATHAMGIDYLPVVFPGYSFANTNRATGQPATPSNQIPRECGLFYWR